MKKVEHLLPARIKEDNNTEVGDEAELEAGSSTNPSNPTKPSEEVFDYEDHTVIVTDLAGTSSLANQPSYRDTAAVDSDDDDDDDDEDDDDDSSNAKGKGYSVDNYKKKSMELFQRLQRIEGKHVNKKQMFLQRKQKKKLLRKMKRNPKKGNGRN